jgi:hypothetical protein
MLQNDKLFSRKLKLFFYNYEYQILVLSGMFSGLLLILITNKFFVNTSIYIILFLFGILISALGFILSYLIKFYKRKAIELEFGYFLSDLAQDYKKTSSLSLSISNISKSNVYGSIDNDIRRIANRVSWGDSFEHALEITNKGINSNIIKHTLIIFNTLKNSDLSLYKILKNISKDILIFKEEDDKKKYFTNLYYLSLTLFFVFIFVMIFLDIIIGSKFLWYSSSHVITRIFFDNFLLYISLLIAIFSSFVIYNIRPKNSGNFIKYVFVLFILVILLFQVFAPKPEANIVLVESVNYLFDTEINDMSLNNVISLKSLSSKYIVDNTSADMIYFISQDKETCGSSCLSYNVAISDATLFNFRLHRIAKDVIVYYDISDE